MAMESAAVDELIEKGKFAPNVALAIAKAIDLTIKAANLVTVPVLDARFAASEAKLEARFGAVEVRFGQMEARFASIEKSIVSTKVWAVCLYAAGMIGLFSALALDHRWWASRQDQLTAQSNQRFEAMLARSDQRVQQMEGRSDQRFQQMQERSDQQFKQIESRLDGLDLKMERIQTLLDPAVRGQPATTQRPTKTKK